MPLNVQVYLSDIIKSCEAIAGYIQGETEESYLQDRKTRAAVERELITIGEALNQALKLHPDIAISDARRIIGFRNVAVHNYAHVESDVVWLIARDFVPILLGEAEAEMRRLDEAQEN